MIGDDVSAQPAQAEPVAIEKKIEKQPGINRNFISPLDLAHLNIFSTNG
jgi:hypothetical protein